MSETISYGRLGGVINAQWAWNEIQMPANGMLSYTLAEQPDVRLISAMPMTGSTLDFLAEQNGKRVVVRLEWHAMVCVGWKGAATS